MIHILQWMHATLFWRSHKYLSSEATPCLLFAIWSTDVDFFSRVRCIASEPWLNPLFIVHCIQSEVHQDAHVDSQTFPFVLKYRKICPKTDTSWDGMTRQQEKELLRVEV